MTLKIREPVPIYKHERAGQECVHESCHGAPEWQTGPVAARLEWFHKYATGSAKRFLVKFEATGHTYALQGREVLDALNKETMRRLPAQPSTRRAPVPTTVSQHGPVNPLWPLELLNPEVGRRSSRQANPARKPSNSR